MSDPGERFRRVYARGEWAREGVLSGNGSRRALTGEVAAWLGRQAEEGFRSVLDLGCGDLNWIAACPAITGRRLRYHGIDVVPSLIAHHRRVFPWFSGEVADLEALPRLGGTKENPQDSEIILLKDVLFHLCNGAAGQILMYVNRTSWRRLLVSSHPGANNLHRRGLHGWGMVPLDVEATGLLDGAPVLRMPRADGGEWLVYERDPRAATEGGQAIPRIIHQTWKDADIPFETYPREWVESWRALHPGWEYRLWTDADLLELARVSYPDFADMVERARGVVKADIGRLLMLHRFGGLYADLDYLCLKPMDGLLSGGSAFVCTMEGGYTHNALMASVPGHPMFLAAAREALARWNRDPHAQPEWLSGPELLGEFAGKWNPSRWSAAQVCPLDWRREAHVGEWRDLLGKCGGAHAVTFWRHNW